ncbi:MAG: diguanylate cyclase [Actinomycetia bacterium]|nr:diguanylate cyclase [Actinomycetes bacterium]
MAGKNIKKEKQPLVLIVDDIAENLQLLGNILKKENYNIAAANNGKQAVAIASDINPDLILLDIMMPEMDGFEVCSKLKNIPETKNIPIIFLTAKVETEDIIKGFKAKAVDYVTKPFNSYELLARVKTHLELKISKNLLEDKNKLLKTLSITDGLTGLHNHRYIVDALSQRISESRRYGQPLSIGMFDIDYFKKINDKYGHIFGDKVLIKISSVIEETIRKVDIAGRYGGEEFLIVMPCTESSGAYTTAERIRESIERIKWDRDGLKITISGGVCEFKDEDSEKLIKKADKLLYKGKKSGRNRIEA